MFRAAWLTSIVWFCSLAAQANERSCHVIPSAELSVDRLIREIKDPKAGIKTVEDVLCRLPADFRKNYLLGFDSKSVQGSSFENPRVVMFDSNHPPKLVISFNGDPSQVGYQHIEVMAPAKPNNNGEVVDLVDLDLSKPSRDRVHTNSKQCMTCHSSSDGSPARPLFNAVPVWPGYYGTRVFSGLIPDGDVKKQAEEFKKFQKAASGNSRYRYLVDLGNVISRTNTEEFGASEGMLPNYRPKSDVLPERNRQFTEDMAALNRPRLLKLIKRTPFYERYKFAIFSAMTSCSDHKERSASSYLPLDLRALHVNTSRLDEILQGPMNKTKWQQYNEKLFSAQKKMMPKFTEAEGLWGDSVEGRFQADSFLRQGFYGANAGLTAKLRFLFESRIRPIDVKAWNIDPQQGEYRFNNNQIVDFDFTALAPLLASKDPELNKFVKSTENFGNRLVVDCDALQKRSLKALSGIAQKMASKDGPTEAVGSCLECGLSQNKGMNLEGVTDVADQTAKSIFMKNCVACHTSGVKNAPAIDFNDLKCSPHTRAEIADRVSLDQDAPDHMPYLGHLGSDEIAAIKTYLKRLKETQPDAGCGEEADWQ